VQFLAEILVEIREIYALGNFQRFLCGFSPILRGLKILSAKKENVVLSKDY
jgi:hypothetical protein